MVNIGNDWDEILKDEFSKEYYLKLRAFLKLNINRIVFIRICMIFLML